MFATAVVILSNLKRIPTLEAGRASKREFYVKTPLGDLHIYAKHENGDVMADYPGVYVDLIREGREPEMLTCVEFDSNDGTMLTTAYDIGCDDPAAYHHHIGCYIETWESENEK